ncbi:MAG TPA: GNAT family N-acetyltransferase [Steroidobacteraceae bacterium]|nr:GNAT family N-acetyltransferase [Steroidobacteraceae bacterium]
MNDTVHIRRYEQGEEAALFRIFHSAVHLVACRDYTTEQIEAWAPSELDPFVWESRVRDINPFVAEQNGELVGYADVQESGYIDHFYVSGSHTLRGIGSRLMRRLFVEAETLGALTLTSDVSRTAQPFFEKFGFLVVELRYPECRGVVVPNAFMRRGQSYAQR